MTEAVRARWIRTGWVSAVFGGLLAAYWPVMAAGFVWNDADYVTRPGLRSLAGLRRIWFEWGATEQYYPMLHSAFWVEHRLWADHPLGYHLTNLALQGGAAVLFGLIWRRLWPRAGEWAAGLAALLFALHPVAVESVAWVTEQKNTLSAVFYLAAALIYLKEGRRASAYLAATVCFLLALMSKSITVTLPGALLVVAWWQEDRLTWRRDVRPLVPWFGLAFVSGAVTTWVERHYVGAEGAAFDLSCVQRCLLAGRAAVFYLGKVLWPQNLVFIYPKWVIDPKAAWQYLFLAFVVGLVVGCWLVRKRLRWPLTLVLLFLGALIPVLGFINVYGFKFSYVADHWAYLAILPVAAAAAAWAERGWGKRPILVGFAAAAVLGTFGAITWRAAAAYHDEVTFYQTILERNPAAWMAHGNLGIILVKQGRVADGIAHYRQALALEPGEPQIHNNLATALSRTGENEAALEEYRAAVKLSPNFAEAHNGLGHALAVDGQTAEAKAEYATALRLKPGYAEPHINLGILLAAEGRNGAAIAEYRKALKLKPDSAEAHCNLGTLLENSRRWGDAIAQYKAALRINPKMSDAYNDWGNALLRSGHTVEAIAQYRAGITVAPGIAAIHCNLGVALLQVGRTDEAKAEFRATLRLSADYPLALAQLAKLGAEVSAAR